MLQVKHFFQEIEKEVLEFQVDMEILNILKNPEFYRNYFYEILDIYGGNLKQERQLFEIDVRVHRYERVYQSHMLIKRL